MKKLILMPITILYTVIAAAQSFTQDNITYQVISSTDTVTIIDNTNTGSISIPQNVTNDDIEYTVTQIDTNAFRDNQITSISIPNTIITIGEAAFFTNPLQTIITQSTTPPNITTVDNTFGDRSIDIVVPPNTAEAYAKAGWTGFRIFYEEIAANPNTLIITKQSNAAGDLIIPATLTHNDITYTVTQIGEDAFFLNGLTSISIPDNVITIERNAFLGNRLTSVTIPDSVTTIGSGAFLTNNLTSIIIPDGITTISNLAFAENSLTEIEIPNSVTAIGERAFRNNELTKLEIPDSVTSIGSGAFKDNPLKQIVAQGTTPPTISINAGIRDILDDPRTIDFIVPPGTARTYALAGWGGFRIFYQEIEANPNTLIITLYSTVAGDLIIPATLTHNDITYTITQIGKHAFQNNEITSVRIPNSVTTIGNSAFSRNELTILEIPNSVTTIGDAAFGSNEKLTKVIAQHTNPPTITLGGDNDPFDNRSTIDLEIPTGTKQTYEQAGWIGFKTTTDPILFIQDNITYKLLQDTDTATIIDNTNTGSISIPENVTNDNIQYTVTQIDANAFNNNQITSISIPNTIKTIGDHAFTTNSLTSVAIPDSVTSIGSGAFKDNPLKQIVAQGTTPPTISINAGIRDILDDPRTIDFIVPPSTARVYALAGWGGFRIFYQEIEANPNTLIITSYSTVAGDLIIPATLTHNDITYTITQIGKHAFQNNEITSVRIPNSVTTIGNSAFSRNELTILEIPNSVTAIGSGAFRNNDELTKVISRGTTPPTITNETNNDPFGGRSNIALEIPTGTKQIYEQAGWIGFKTTTEVIIFTLANITYKVLPDTDTVTIIHNTNTGSINIPQNVTNDDIQYTITQIDANAFNNNEITSISIPNTIKTIGDDAFANNELTQIIAQGTTPPMIPAGADNTFDDLSTIDIVVPPNTAEAYAKAGWTGFRIFYEEIAANSNSLIITKQSNATGDLTIPATITHNNTNYTVTVIGTLAFTKNGVTSVTIPNTVTTIERRAFLNNELTSVIIPNSVITIEIAVFQNNQLTSVTLPSSITTIGLSAFLNNELTKLEIPNSVTAIRNSAFKGNKLTQVISRGTTPPTITTLNSSTFGGTTARSTIDLLVPLGTKDAYLANGWTGFKSIEEISLLPVITLIGVPQITIELGDTFADPGAIALDNNNGDITDIIDIDNPVDTAVVGTYTITYNVTDAAGNKADPVNRTVNVVDTTPPVITLNGDNPQTIPLDGNYTELGATVTDLSTTDIDLAIDSSDVDTSVAGSYTVTYNATDAAGNTAVQVDRTVNVVDMTPPVITLLGDNPQRIELGGDYTELGATALDNVDGDLTNSLTIDSSSVDTSILGDYLVTYTVTDAAGNTATLTRTVQVVQEATAPVITVLGDQQITLELGDTFTDPGATAVDNSGVDITNDIITNNPVDTAIADTYTITYNVTDASGNTAVQVIRTVIVQDTTPPVITLNGDNPQRIQIGADYIELGATVTDLSGGDIDPVIDSSAVDTSVVGDYTVTYNATDASGNLAIPVDRTVIVTECPIANDNFTLQSLAETCSGKNNGAIRINAKTELDYTLTINEQQLPFTSELLIADLAPATYPICITANAFNNCQQCFEVVINPGINIAGTTAIQQQAFGNTKLQVAIQTGTPPYTVYVNGLQKTVSQNKNFSIPVANGDQVEVSSALECQGKLTTKVQLEDELQLYPNPTQGDVTLTLGTTALKNIAVVIYNPLGIAVSKAKLSVANRQVIIPMSTLSKGMYILQLPEIGKTFKVIKN